MNKPINWYEVLHNEMMEYAGLAMITILDESESFGWRYALRKLKPALEQKYGATPPDHAIQHCVRVRAEYCMKRGLRLLREAAREHARDNPDFEESEVHWTAPANRILGGRNL